MNDRENFKSENLEISFIEPGNELGQYHADVVRAKAQFRVGSSTMEQIGYTNQVVAFRKRPYVPDFRCVMK